jgi:hypothetical protein
MAVDEHCRTTENAARSGGFRRSLSSRPWRRFPFKRVPADFDDREPTHAMTGIDRVSVVDRRTDGFQKRQGKVPTFLGASNMLSPFLYCVRCFRFTIVRWQNG